MIAMTADDILLMVWIGFTFLALVGVIAVFVWAVRARQFAGQDRARYLPLRSHIPGEEEEAADGEDAAEGQGRGKHAPV